MYSTIYLMTKVPMYGLNKTRLSKVIGNNKAKRFTLLNIESLKKKFLKSKKHKLFFYLTPLKKFRSFSIKYYNNTVLQKGKDLGQKIWYVKSLSKQKCVIVGSDIPDITNQVINDAFKFLDTSDLVIGPTYDNGFWLIGFSNKKAINYPFKNIRWSSENTLSDLIKNLKKNNIKFKICKKLTDIDIIDDYCNYIHKV
tara:strand:+ start:567 stop:1157 length:591 start_codon:yes stop_codon:yes gene_type:complete